MGIEMAGPNTLTLTDATFDEAVLKSEVPVLVDFWAEWCGPCKMIGPTIDTIAADYAGRIKVGKLNVDENGGTATRYQIRGIPTLLVFKDGKIVDQIVGAAGKTQIQKALDAHL
jgi:thioredoxin 1